LADKRIFLILVGVRKKQALASAKPDFSSLPEYNNLLLAAQKQLLELPLIFRTRFFLSNSSFATNLRFYRRLSICPIFQQFFSKKTHPAFATPPFCLVSFQCKH